jgi:chromosomal replication initiation ATPase DnaA
MTNRTPRPWVVPGLIRSHMPLLTKINLKADHVVKMVCSELGITEEQMRQKRKNRSIVTARQMVVFFLCHASNMSLKDMGVFLRPAKPFDHTTMIYSRETMRDLISTDDKIARQAQRIYSRLIASGAELTIPNPQTNHKHDTRKLETAAI